MTAPQRRSSVPFAVGENRERIRIIERIPPNVETLSALITRDGTAPFLTIASDVLNNTTTYVYDFTVETYNRGMVTDLANGTITVPVDGFYLVEAMWTWSDDAGTFGVCVATGINDFGQSGIYVPMDCRDRADSDFTYQPAIWTWVLAEGDIISMGVGQNSGMDQSNSKLASLQATLIQKL